MRLRCLIDNMDRDKIPATFLDVEIPMVCSDSRTCTPGSLFVALEGATGHGSQFISDALGRGARVIVVENSTDLSLDGFNGLVLPVKDTRKFFTELLQRFYDYPDRKIKTIGVTGTNGKTTITYLLESILRCAGRKSGVIGTVSHRIGSKIITAKNTTPGIADNFRYLSEMVKAGMDYCLMEVSSHALDQKRVDGINFHAALFTNLTGDHLDYHKNEEDYFLAKARLFQALAPDSLAVINRDDAYGDRLAKMTPARIITYAIGKQADITAKDIELGLTQTTFVLNGLGRSVPIKTSLFGKHNVYNILAVAGLCFSEGISDEDIQKGISALDCVPGRMDPVAGDKDFHVYIDFAHTEDALKNVLNSVKHIPHAKTILVFGCGGDRDRTKRPKMGRVASQLADFSIVTNDNPRSENPEDIALQIVAGFENKNYKVTLDRRQAIHDALRMARKGDIVLIAGKGHESYQIFKDKTVPFNEKEIVQEMLASL